MVILIICEAAWKLAGMWKAARNNQLGRFICIALINTVGILPIVYILKKKREAKNRCVFVATVLITS